MRHQRQDRPLRFRQRFLGNFDPGGTKRGNPSCTRPTQCPAFGQYLARGRHLGSKGGRPDPEPLTPTARWPQIDMDEARAWIKPEPKKPHCPRRRLECNRIMVAHRDIKCRTFHVL